MPRLLDPNAAVDKFKEEIAYTEVTMEADPNAQDLLPAIAGWWPAFEEFRRSLEESGLLDLKLEFRQTLVHAHLKDITSLFGKTLYAEERDDRTTPRWIRFFGNNTASAVADLPYADLLNACGDWLKHDQDPLLARHLPALTLWVQQGQQLRAQQSAHSDAAAKRRETRQAFAKFLNDERQVLEAKLQARSRERSLGPHWSKFFFKRGR